MRDNLRATAESLVLSVVAVGVLMLIWQAAF
jgi:hypothetical protein